MGGTPYQKERRGGYLKVRILLIGQGSRRGLLELGLVLLHEGGVDLDLRRGEGGGGDEL